MLGVPTPHPVLETLAPLVFIDKVVSLLFLLLLLLGFKTFTLCFHSDAIM